MEIPVGLDLEPGRLPDAWRDAAVHAPSTGFATHAYNADFLVLRQSGRTHFEKPFLYLVFGTDAALLVDTGAPGARVAQEVEDVLAARHARGLPVPARLIVAHTHGHADHVAGDAQFAGRAGTEVLGLRVSEVTAAFHIGRWPDEAGSVDLGGRVLDVVAVPGHEPSSVAFYDRRTGILLTGDLLYPGRLYVRDADAFRASVSRLVAFTRSRPVAHVLGAHVENTRTPYLDYPEGTEDQPDEHTLELGRAHLLELEDALASMAPGIERRRLRDFSVWPLQPREDEERGAASPIART